MNPKSAWIPALCLMAIAGGIVWKRMAPEADRHDERVSLTPRSGKASERDGSVRPGRADAGGAAESGGETAAPEIAAVAGEPLETAADAFQRTARQLVTDLGLSDGQAEGLREILARREKQLQNLLTGPAPGGAEDPGAVIGRICALLRNKGLRDDLAGILSPRQLAAYDAGEAKRQREMVEARAYREFAEVNAVARLEEGQKQEVLGAFMTHAPDWVEQEADARAFLSITYGPVANDMSPADIRTLVDRMEVDPSGVPHIDDGGMEHLLRIEKREAERINVRLSALRNILNEDQLARYRAHLEGSPPR